GTPPPEFFTDDCLRSAYSDDERCAGRSDRQPSRKKQALTLAGLPESFFSQVLQRGQAALGHLDLEIDDLARLVEKLLCRHAGMVASDLKCFARVGASCECDGQFHSVPQLPCGELRHLLTHGACG